MTADANTDLNTDLNPDLNADLNAAVRRRDPRRSSPDLLNSIASAIVHIPSWLVLAISGVLMTAIFWFAFTVRYGLDTYGSLPNQSIATLNHMSAEGALLYIASFVALSGLYALAMKWGLRGSKLIQWILVVGFAVVMNVALLRMDPTDAADIYDYIIRGRMSAVYGMNPLHDTPNAVPFDPFYPLVGWKNVASAYGPAWEMIASVTSRVAGSDFTTNVIDFKLVSIAGFLATLALIGLTLRILAPRRTLLGVFIFAWNPFLVYVTGSRGHNDTIMTAFILLSVYFLARKWYVASTLAAVLGALVKFIPILLVPLIAVVAWRELRGSRRVRYLAASAVLGGAMLVGFYAPYWAGLSTLSIERRGTMFTGSVATLARQALSPTIDGNSGESSATPTTDALLQRFALGAFIVFYLYELNNAYRDRDKLAVIRATARILLFYLMVSATWFQSWYVMWVVALVALLDDSPMRRLVLYFSYLVTWQSFLYNYVTLRPGNWMPIPWRDLIPIAVVMLPTWIYVAWFWVSTWLRRAVRTPLAIVVGERLQRAREAVPLSVIDLADELNLRTDDLTGYERGERALPLETGHAIAQRLGVPLTELLAQG